MRRMLTNVLLVTLAVWIDSAGVAQLHHASAWGAGNQSAADSVTSVPQSAQSFAAGTYNESITAPPADGGTRTYVLHIPAGYAPTKTYPLVLLFHGGTGTGTRVLASTRFGEKADREGFIVVAPDGVGGLWNEGRGTANTNINDADFVRLLIAKLESELPIDQNRVYATGISGGGHLTGLLGCNLPGTFAALATDVGPIAANLLSSCKTKPVSVVGIQGDADPLTPINGGWGGGGYARASGGYLASAVQTMQLWAGVDRCNPIPTITDVPPAANDGTSVTKYSYSGCAAHTDVVYHIVHGMGHVWPPSTGYLSAAVTGPNSHNINATEVFWEFFSAHSK
jgi:polyhydroxybutyrate depolymerase